MIDLVIQRLETMPVRPFKIVGGLAELAALKGPPPQFPAIYVYPLEESGGGNTRMNAVSQKVTIKLGFTILNSNLQDQRGQAAVKDLAALRLALKDRVFAWQPEGAVQPFTFVSGQLMDAQGGIVEWADIYETAAHYHD